MTKLPILSFTFPALLGGACLSSVLVASLALSQVDRNFGSFHLLLGNPSGATLDAANPDNLLLIKPQYALSYNKSKSLPNWVSWQLNQKWLGSPGRCKNSAGQDNFQPDRTLPAGIASVLPGDYEGSGFDRGHMTPSGDRTVTRADNCATFLMTNIIPQSPDVNRIGGPWESLESYSRDLVEKQGKELYIISGGVGTGGTGSNGFRESFQGARSRNTISVPASSWKVIVVLDTPNAGLEGITDNTRVIAVVMPHQQGVRGESWDLKVDGQPKYITTVREIETLTGYNFLSNVPPAVQDVIETKVDQGS